MTWATKRKLQYLSAVFVLFLLVLFIILYPIIFKKPTCIDNIMNGTETGVDCGGSCSLMCKEKTSDPIIFWSRAFPVVGKTYNLVAFIEISAARVRFPSPSPQYPLASKWIN